MPGWSELCELPEVREGLLEFIPWRKLRKISCAWCAQGMEGSYFTGMNSAVEIPLMMSEFNRGEDLIRMYI